MQACQTVNGTTTSSTYNAANQLTAAGATTFTYDANGNETSSSAGLSLGYNAKDQTSSLMPAAAQPWPRPTRGPLRSSA